MPRVSMCRYTLHLNRGNYSHEEFVAEVVEDDLDCKLDGAEAADRGDALMKIARSACVRAAKLVLVDPKTKEEIKNAGQK